MAPNQSWFDPERSYPNVRDLYSASEYPNLRTNVPEDPGDRLMICSCKRETILKLWKGPHPFKTLKCAGCDQTPNQQTFTTEILKQIGYPILRVAIVPEWRYGELIEVPYGSVCPGCGLTYRAKVLGFGIDGPGTITLDFGRFRCSCGFHTFSSWVRFFIGSPRAYHTNPLGVYGEYYTALSELATVGKMRRNHTQLIIPGRSVYRFPKGNSFVVFAKAMTKFVFRAPRT
jgi:hypothetical protein